MRRRVIVEGALKSVASTGSQITNTRRWESDCDSSNDSSAEAPRTQTGQVGERSTSMRTFA